jgi:Acetyl-CoA carboxylase, carboxyltransferase component (subunits alpha and beta)
LKELRQKEKGEKFDEKLDKQLVELIEAAAEKESLALSASSMVTDDGIIDPRDTRNVLGFCLSVVDNNEVKGAKGYGVFRL